MRVTMEEGVENRVQGPGPEGIKGSVTLCQRSADVRERCRVILQAIIHCQSLGLFYGHDAVWVIEMSKTMFLSVQGGKEGLPTGNTECHVTVQRRDAIDKALTIRDTYLSPNSGPSIVLSTLQVFNLVFRATHFTDEEIESESLNALSKVTHLASGRAQPGSQVFFMPKSQSPTTAYCTPPPASCQRKYCDGDKGW